MFARPRPFPVLATLLTLTGVGVLGSLGVWQVERLEWKNNLQASLYVEFAMPADRELRAQDLDFTDSAALRRGTIKGHLDFSKQVALGGQIVAGKSVYYHVLPLKLTQGQTVFVVIAYSDTPALLPTPSARAQTDVVSGVARVPSWNRFTPENIPAQSLWYRADIDAMAAHLDVKSALPVLFYAEKHPYKLDALPTVPVEHKLKNDHAQYAIFWFTMAALLAVIYVLRFWRKKA